VEIEELKNIIKSENLEMNKSDQNLEVIEDRLYALRSQARKHDCQVNDLINIKKDLEIKLENISNQKESLEDLYKENQNAIDEFISMSKLLSNSRKKYAEILTNKINLELPHLKLENANINIKFEELSIENASKTGIDKVLFLATTNYGIDMLPINKIASGGELSRFLLAVKVVLESVIHNRTIIFDEIDSGIGGATATAVGSRLAKLGENYQTLVVTHSPQVTSKGHHHYIVQKDTTNSITTTNVLKLSDNQRVEEVARMVSGNIITTEAREAASKLLNTK
ncbi:DNA repair protein RecN, partial [Alphaproteobacteria bacterium]|nr:DNA repair protein RecN [Alphaproteobacteria bacterium]